VFYKQRFEPGTSKQYLAEMLSGVESIIFIAIENGKQAGFTQLYPSFSSVAMVKIWVLNDLFVSTGFRQRGIAQLLIIHTIEYWKQLVERKLFCQWHTIISMLKNCMKSGALPDPDTTITK